MIHPSSRLVLAACVLAVAAPPTASAVDPHADVILVRRDCGGVDNCFTVLESALAWTWGTRNPGPGDRLLIDLGPGRWMDQFYCNGQIVEGSLVDGFVTVRGAGRDATIVTGHQGSPSGGELELRSAAEIVDCTELEFLDMGFESPDFTVYWSGPGKSTWTDVDIVNPGTGTGSVGWYEDRCDAEERQGRHDFFDSRIETWGRKNPFGIVPATAYWSKCSETWFYGGQIHWVMNETNANPGAAVLLHGHSDFHAFGTAIRVTVPDGALAVGPLTGVSVSDLGGFPGTPDGRPATFHMHGGIVSVRSNAGSYAHAYGLRVDGPHAMAHTAGTAFALESSFAATRIEISRGGIAEAPFQWATGPTPPEATGETGGIVSAHGQDMFVETDCAADGRCGSGAGTETHLMIHNTSCTPTPWFDVATGACRAL